MNLQAAQKSLRGRSPKIMPGVLVLEGMVMVGAGMLLVQYFA